MRLTSVASSALVMLALGSNSFFASSLPLTSPAAAQASIYLFAQPEMMASVGLGVPEAAKLCAMLREKGLNLPNDLYTQEELQEHILRLWKEVHHA